jgi:hypothetical protein
VHVQADIGTAGDVDLAVASAVGKTSAESGPNIATGDAKHP